MTGRGREVYLGSWALALAGLALVLASPAAAQDTAADGVTFARDVAPILQENCQSCHRPGGMGPMPLVTYEDARPFAPLIRDRVENRRMPPWYIEPGIGVQDFKNDISLSDAEIGTILAWVDGGAVLGDVADLPPPLEFDDSLAWKLEDHFGRPPDLVVASPPYTVPAEGLDHWYEPTSYVEGLDEPRWAMATEIRPGDVDSRYVFHHANSALASSAAGKDYDLFPDDSGKLIQPGQRIRWAMHFFPAGRVVEDAHIELGIWLYPPGERPEFEVSHVSWLTDPKPNRTVLQQDSPCWEQPAPVPLDSPECTVETRLTDLVLPPNGLATQQGIHVMPENVRLNSIRGHMHMRGRYQTMEAIYPDGRREVINRINWDHKWHTAHQYADHAAPLLPKGTVLIVTAQYDNTVNNPNNPDPDQWVFFGRRSADEMGHFHMEVTWLGDQDFERLVAEREELVRQVSPNVEDGG
ncbi:MAG: cytochrome c [Gammaproteobacteria bacterium]|nr:cytochrome c [Gammaproteobacteria bacterium]